MAESDQGEKTEEPTQQRREDFRKRGQVAQTKELASVFILLSALVIIWFLSKFFFSQLFEIFNMAMGKYLVVAVRGGDMMSAFRFAAEKTFMLVGPLMGMLWVISFASSALQIGFLTNEEAMKFDIKKINPVEGFKRVFSLKSLMEGAKAIFKVSIVGLIAYVVLESEILRVPSLVEYSMGEAFTFIGEVSFKILGGVIFFMAVLAGIDFLFQKWDLEQKMKMTKQEVKEEHKSREGDPLIKARIRRVQREMSQKRMMNDVPKADVIITNPTHIAVALKYSNTMIAPMVVAKGAGLVAEKIKEIAKENNVPIMENKPLARTIYKTIKIGQAIPRELYTAVAEVLSYIFKLKRKNKRS